MKMSNANIQARRDHTLEGIRAVAAFLVIVNHTNSRIFQSLTPASGSWWLSLLWYYISKADVPLFVMVSGACLLGRSDSVRKCAVRFLRVLAVYIITSLLYRLGSGASLGTALLALPSSLATDSLWYLVFYMGLLLCVPFVQRLYPVLSRRGKWYLAGICLLTDGGLRLLCHYLPTEVFANYLGLPCFTGYLGLFLLGRLLCDTELPPKIRRIRIPAAVLSLALCVLLTFLEYRRVEGNGKYWFMDDRMHPALLVCLFTASLFTLLRSGFSRVRGSGMIRLISAAGGCAFGCYLLQDAVIQHTYWSVYMRLCTPLPAFPAVILWELLVYAVCMGIAWVLKRIPGLRRLI